MASITLTIPDEVAVRVRNGFCYQQGYQDTINDKPNPETKTQFMKRMLTEHIKLQVKAYETTLSMETARQEAELSVDSGIVIS